MGRSPCCDKLGLKKGPWTPDEDQKLLAYIEEFSHGNWRALPAKAGLQRCGKSCRLRWTNYLRPDIKRGKFSLQEEQTIIQLHALLGNRWSAIATHLPKRTDNEIKNYWNTHLKKRLTKMGIDPVTHKPKNDALHSTADCGKLSKNAANLSHMAQWESARLEAEARLVRQSKLQTSMSSHQLVTSRTPPPPPPPPPVADNHHHQLLPGSAPSSSSSTSAHHEIHMSSLSTATRCLDVLKAWHSVWPNTTTISTNEGVDVGLGLGDGHGGGPHGIGVGVGVGAGIESPTSTLSFSENGQAAVHAGVIEFMMMHDGHDNSNNNDISGSCDQQDQGIVKEGGGHEWKPHFNRHHRHDGIEKYSMSFSTSSGLHDIGISAEAGRGGNGHDDEDQNHHDDHHHDDDDHNFMEGFTELLLNNTATTTSNGKSLVVEDGGAETDINGGGGGSSSTGSDYYEDNKNYWNSILNLVNSSPSDSPMF